MWCTAIVTNDMAQTRTLVITVGALAVAAHFVSLATPTQTSTGDPFASGIGTPSSTIGCVAGHAA